MKTINGIIIKISSKNTIKAKIKKPIIFKKYHKLKLFNKNILIHSKNTFLKVGYFIKIYMFKKISKKKNNKLYKIIK